MYLPSIGLVACVVMGMYWITDRTGIRLLAPAILCLAITALGWRTWVRNPDWQDDLTMTTASLQAAPNSFKLHRTLASLLFSSSAGDTNLDRAIEEAEKTLSLLNSLPDAQNNPLAWRQAGAYYLRKGDSLLETTPDGRTVASAESKRDYRRALEVLVRCAAIDKAVRDAYLQRAGKSLQIRPEVAQTHQLLSQTYLRLGDNEQAGVSAARALALHPGNAIAYRQIAFALTRANRNEEAATALFEGMFLTSDQTLTRELGDLFKRGLDPQGCALQEGGIDPVLNFACDAVHRHVCAAAPGVIEAEIQAGRPDLAEKQKLFFGQDQKCQ
jgi:hypothetical protein